ncbi:uncharacterized protein N7459_003493 [Penicillium hispanicum]|uniref:uncharacterized protein n=1 Tax=Penicillium hispanicum TaxID=1080232 RepID=UPI002541CB17|nr:uncharacterized protein N7459_003493 [Penicillium hispanicum]KAJ5587728.1 hypothetical protein N7459_003493 [Penicillium hispanicum]
MANKPDELPATSKDWQEDFLKLGLTGQTVSGASLLKFLPGINKWISEANKKLSKYKSWDTYLKNFLPPDFGEGSFAVARYYQVEVTRTENDMDSRALATPIAHRTRAQVKAATRGLANLHLQTPSKSTNLSQVLDPEGSDLDLLVDSEPSSPETPSPLQQITPAPKELENVLYPPTKDEQIVNCALVIFLNALTMRFIFNNHWTLHRKALKATFRDTSFEARTDGYLGDSQGYARVLIEVKPVMREKKSLAIQMQETAQMVAWIKSDPEKLDGTRKLRLHISQDRHEIYLTVAEYDDDYIRYLTDERKSTKAFSFLTMHEFGPWSTQDASHMRELGPILLAISLRAEAGQRSNWT